MKILTSINKRVFQPIFRKLTGWSDLQEHVDTMHFILDHCLDITEAQKATGELRKTQLAAAEFLRIFHEICVKHDIYYWLDYGTLLGAVRHGGFIPWDDDMDISMTLDDFYKADKILPCELKKYGFEYCKMSNWGAAFSKWDAGIILDVFTIDSVNPEYASNHNEVRKRLEIYNKYWLKHKNETFETINDARHRIIGKEDNNGIWYHTAESDFDQTVFDNSTIFPLRQMKFEGYDFFIPNNYDIYLQEEFGNYMSFPKNGVLHHHGGGGNPIYMNAKRKEFDIDEFTNKMKTIHII